MAPGAYASDMETCPTVFVTSKRKSASGTFFFHMAYLLGDRNKMGLSWHLRKYRDGDEQAIVELLNIAFGRWHNLEYWKWRYKKNPAGSPIIWLAEHDSKIIGHCAVIPIRMKVGNTYITGSFNRNAATHPEYQGKGVFSSIINRCYQDAAEKDIPLTYGFANINLGPTYKRYEWRGHICFLVYVTKVLDWEPRLSRYIHNKFLARAAACVLGKIRRPRSTNGSLIIERISRFDERINRFWEGISKHFKIIVKRDQKYLNWRYADYPENKYTIYTAVKDHRILGYCVLSEEQHENMRYGIIVDILGFQDYYNAVGYLIQRAVECFKEHDVDEVVCMLSEKHPYTSIFRKAGFITPLRRKRALHAAINLRGSSIDEKAAYEQALTLSQSSFLKEKRNWFMMSGDN